MKRIMKLLLVIIMIFAMTACSKEKEVEGVVPLASNMKSICELATMKCYYHNVAKYYEAEATGHLWWTKDRNFWVEYSGVVTIGVDASKVKIDVNDNKVTITIPPAKVLGCEVDETTLNEDSFVIAKNSAKVEAEHQTEAFKDAQSKMESEAANDTALLSSAQERAKKLLEDYIHNIEECVNKQYEITWLYIEE